MFILTRELIDVCSFTMFIYTMHDSYAMQIVCALSDALDFPNGV